MWPENSGYGNFADRWRSTLHKATQIADSAASSQGRSPEGRLARFCRNARASDAISGNSS
jgi:hypothetical protein